MQSQYGNGALAERLGTGLQNLLQRFDSARHLTKNASQIAEGHFWFRIVIELLLSSLLKTTREIAGFYGQVTDKLLAEVTVLVSNFISYIYAVSFYLPTPSFLLFYYSYSQP